MNKREKSMPGVVASNRKARHDYHIDETIECGIKLVGSEVKSLRQGKASLADAYAMVRDGEVWLMSAHIPPYKQASIMNHEPLRSRKLLLHRKEIDRLTVRSQEQGFTLVPLRLYFKEGMVKCEMAIARGKKLHDKREAIATRDAEREMRRREGARRKA